MKCHSFKLKQKHNKLLMFFILLTDTYEMVSPNGTSSFHQCRKETVMDTGDYQVHLFCPAIDDTDDFCPKFDNVFSSDLKAHLTVSEVEKTPGNLRKVILQYESNKTFVNETCGNTTCLWSIDTNSVDVHRKILGPLKKGRIYIPLIEAVTKMSKADYIAILQLR